jgi:hypothetical protein
MDDEQFKENLKVAKEILDALQMPGKKDSMLAAAKADHIERVGILLNDILVTTGLSQEEIDSVVIDFKERYRNTFLKFIQKEG